MTVKKVSVSLEPEVLDEVKEFAGANGVSAFLNEAAKAALQRARVLEYLAELDHEFGPVGDEAIAEAHRRLTARAD